jgi:hypothetical protein
MEKMSYLQNNVYQKGSCCSETMGAPDKLLKEMPEDTLPLTGRRQSLGWFSTQKWEIYVQVQSMWGGDKREQV